LAAADGVNVSWQDAVAVLPVAASVQLAELPNDPEFGAAAKLAVPVGVLAPVAAVSVTVAVHVVPVPTVSADGEQPTLVDVGSTVAAVAPYVYAFPLKSTATQNGPATHETE